MSSTLKVSRMITNCLSWNVFFFLEVLEGCGSCDITNHSTFVSYFYHDTYRLKQELSTLSTFSFIKIIQLFVVNF